MYTKIVLNRKKEMANRMNSVQVLIDGTESGQIATGSSEGFEVTPGTHTMQCKINWFSSAVFTVNIAANETKFLRVRSGMKYYTISYILILVALFLGIVLRIVNIPRPALMSVYQVILTLPFILTVLYYFTIGRKQYLVLEEDKDTIFN